MNGWQETVHTFEIRQLPKSLSTLDTWLDLKEFFLHQWTVPGTKFCWACNKLMALRTASFSCIQVYAWQELGCGPHSAISTQMLMSDKEPSLAIDVCGDHVVRPAAKFRVAIKEIDNDELVTLKWYLEILIEGMYRLFLTEAMTMSVPSSEWCTK